MSVRLRLTLVYSLILVLTLLAFGMALYASQAAAANDRSRAMLANAAQGFLSPRRFTQPLGDSLARRFARPEIYVQLRDAGGAIAERTPNLEENRLPLSAAGQQAVRSGGSWYETTQLANVHLMIYSAPILLNGQLTGMVQVARSLAEQDQARKELLRFGLIAGAIATVLAFGLGWFFAGTALRPIGRLTETAQIIGAERDFDRRVEHTGPNDEIGRLAATFNTMLTELQLAYRQTEQALHAQRRFVADASHELRTPLTIIRGNLGLLGRDPPISQADRIAVLSDTIDESERMNRLVHDLLALARSDAGPTLHHEPVQIVSLIDELCRKIRTLDPSRTIDTERLPALEIAGDHDALKQVLVILLDNARKFTPPHGTISITASATNALVAIHVRDSGCGIDPAALPHIFERFFRGDSARTGAGAGLGLAIAAGLVEAMGGRITVESTVGQGSTFTVSLPRATSSGIPLAQTTNTEASRELQTSEIAAS